MKILRSKVHPFDIEELVCKITGLDYDEIDADTSIMEEKLIDEFGCDLGQFQDIIERLLPLVSQGQSPLTEKYYKGFADEEKGMWLTKMEVK